MGRAHWTKEILKHAHSLLENIIEKCLRSDSLFRYTEEDDLVLFAKSLAHFYCCCSTIYIMREAHKDWLFEKYISKDMIVIDCEDEDKYEGEETSNGFMSSHLVSWMDFFKHNLAI